MKQSRQAALRKSPPGPMTAAQFQAATGVGEGVLERLGTFVELLDKWQPAINLVSPASHADVWRRHILDSAQLHPFLPPSAPLVIDLGSGGGFPGMVLAIMGGAEVHLVDSDTRKCAFLNEVRRATGAAATVHNSRIEGLQSWSAAVVTGRALAPLERLVGYAYPLLGEGGMCLFLKGAKVDQELTDSQKKWTMRVTRIRSLSDPTGTILKLQEILPHHGN